MSLEQSAGWPRRWSGGQTQTQTLSPADAFQIHTNYLLLKQYVGIDQAFNNRPLQRYDSINCHYLPAPQMPSFKIKKKVRDNMY